MRRTLESILLLFTAVTGGIALAGDAPRLGSHPAETQAYSVCFTFDPLAAPPVSRVSAALVEPLEGPPSLLISLLRSDQRPRRCELELTAPLVVVNVKFTAGVTKAVLMRVDRQARVTTFYIEPLS